MMKCVICKKEFQNAEYTPFCSLRCKNIDLAHWFNGDYVIHEQNNEKKAGQDTETSLYNNLDCPDSSVGRAED